MKKLVLVLNDLAEVGKSACAQVVHGIYHRAGLRDLLVVTDPDGSSQFPEAEQLEIAEGMTPEDVIALLDRAEVVIIDVHTDGAAVMAEFFAEEEMGTLLVEMETELTVVLPANREAEGYEGMLELAESFSDDADYLVVHTPVKAELESEYERSEASRALEYLGAIEIEMPEFDADTLKQIEEDSGVRLAVALAERNQFPRPVRDELHRWELRFAGEFEEAEEFLMPGRGSATASPYRKAKRGGRGKTRRIGLAS